MKKLLIVTLCLVHSSLFAQKSKKEDIAAIKSMCGCFDVDFNFAETFAQAKDYEFHDNYTSGGLEYVFPVEESKDKIVLQHLLIVGDSMIIKHWRQDWIFENTAIYAFHKENTWNYQTLSGEAVKGQWTQKVYQVDDSPRYEASGSWIHADGKHYWEAVADAPLPRREFSKRKDYNIMTRKNRQEITEYGWVHEQDNKKVIREAGKDTWLASEKGWNTYTKTDASRCQIAADWWGENKLFWADVRAVWDEVFAQKKEIKINMRLDGKVMFQRIFALQDKLDKKDFNTEKSKAAIREVLKMHLDGDYGFALN
ncbi:MAG: hypothetical protein F6K11_31095 [Leptolyngbya sp. SIO3F4]|nr:hypothetical protein [Leptolyngbya sp. SIO3F4]